MAEKASRKKNFISLRVKLLLGFTLLFTVVFAGAYYWFYQFSTTNAMNRIVEDLSDTLRGTAAGINTADLVALAEPDVQPNAAGMSDDPRYIAMLDWLDRVHAIEPRAWPYAYVSGDEENEVVFIADLWSRYNPERAGAFQESYISDGTMTVGFEEFSIYAEIYDDDWGSWGISGYTPLYDAQGRSVGALGIDFQADYVVQVQQRIIDSMVMAFIVTYAILFTLIYAFARVLTQPIQALTRIAERIGEGEYEQDFGSLVKDRFPDEIDTLASVFEIMVNKVYQREQSLRQQVEELKIEIDVTKRQKQVSEIVDSDFFQDLQAQARTMRGRRTHSAE